MSIHLGSVSDLVRYPVKSMAGIPTESALLGWHGLDGDRRFAFRRSEDATGFHGFRQVASPSFSCTVLAVSTKAQASHCQLMFAHRPEPTSSGAAQRFRARSRRGAASA